MANRIVYVEPNDIVKDHIQATNTNSDFTWNPEDLNLYVDLQVVVPNRNDCGEEPSDIQNTTYVSLMEGVKIGDSKALTTDYINVSYNEIKNNNVSSKEALGITSIDITFDAHFYPKVQINFTDVRAYSLFMPAEEQHKEGLKNEAHEVGKYQDTGRAYTNFFSAVFHFPYPRFLLTVKGFYGTKVTFVLAVDTFKSSFNSNTGNFDVSISFIGYMYGIYTEIPMSYIACAPYVEPLAESSEDGFIKSKYWADKVNDGTFKTIEGETIPTFLEFAKKYAIALNDKNSLSNANLSNTNDLSDIINLIANVDIIKETYKKLIDTFGINKNGGEKQYIYDTRSEATDTYTFYVTNSLSPQEVNWDKEVAEKLYGLITATNNKYSNLLDKLKFNDKQIKTPSLIKIKDAQDIITSGYVIGDFNEIFKITKGANTKKSTVEYKIDKTNNAEKYFADTPKINTIDFGNNKDIPFDENNKDKEVLRDTLETYLNNNTGVTYGNLRFCALDFKTDINNLDNLKRELEAKKGELQKVSIEEASNYISQSLGFTPSIQNIFRMVFAHLECFFHVFLDETIYKIKEEKSTRTLKELGLKQGETDIKFLDKDGNAFVPPFFAFFETNPSDGAKKIAYPGNSTNSKITNIKEVQLIDKFLKASERFNEEYNTIQKEIEELSETLTDEELDNLSNDNNNSFSNSFNVSFNMNDTIAVNSLDVFYDGRNPYSYLNKDSKTLLLDIFYLFYLRFVSVIGSVPQNILTYHSAYLLVREVDYENIKKIFPNMTKDMFVGYDKETIVDRLAYYSKNKIYPIGKFPDSSFPIIPSFDVSQEFNENEREEFLFGNGEVNGKMYTHTPNYFNGIHILGDGEKFKYFSLAEMSDEGYFTKYNYVNCDTNRNSILKDATEYIISNMINNTKNAAWFPWHEIYRYYRDAETRMLTLSDITTGNTKVQQFPTDADISKDNLTLPFIMCGYNIGITEYFKNMLYLIAKGRGLGEYHIIDNKGSRTEYEVSFKDMTDIGKSFFILAGLIVNIKDINDSGGGINIGEYVNTIYITKSRKIIALYYGCLMYLVRQKMLHPESKELVPNLITITTETKDDKEIEDFKIKNTVCPTKQKVDPDGNRNRGRFYEYYFLDENANKDAYTHDLIEKEKVYDDYVHDLIRKLFIFSYKTVIPETELETKPLKDIIIEDEITDLENLFLYEVNNGILSKILYSAKDELSQVEENVEDVHFTYGADDNGDTDKTINLFPMYPTEGNTSRLLVKLMSDTVTVMSTKFYWDHLRNYIESVGMNVDIQNLFDKLYNGASDEITIDVTTSGADSITSQLKTPYNDNTRNSLYYTFKSLYDKWICSYGNMKRFSLGKPLEDENVKNTRFVKGQATSVKREINNFVFLDSLYREIGQTFICDPVTLINSIKQIIEGQSNVSVYQFLHKFCQDNTLMMRAVPVYNNFYTENGLKEIFMPKNVFNINEGMENNFASTYLIMYTHEPSKYLADPSSNYINDGMDIGRTIVTTDTESLFSGEGYVAPTFGVTYGMQNQSYFKGININMDNPITTDYSIANTLQLAQNGTKGGDLNLPLGIGQNIYSIYSNRSYNCVVEMMGCANIMPMMYFQLNNIPMFKGVYMITSVKHSIRGGNMTTTFTGVRQTSIIYPFINQTMILSSVLSRISEIGNSKSTRTAVSYENPYSTQPITSSVDSGLKIEYMSLLDVQWVPHTLRKYPLKEFTKNRTISKIVLHYTAGASSTEGYAKTCRSTWNGQWNKDMDYEASADFAVDDGGVVQFNPDLDHFSTFATANNADKISIEMCSIFNKSKNQNYQLTSKTPPNMPQWEFSNAVLENTKKLVLELFKKYGKKLEIIRHYDVKGKIKTKDGSVKDYYKPCPGIIGWNNAELYDENGNKTGTNNNSTKFEEFKKSIYAEWDKIKP